MVTKYFFPLFYFLSLLFSFNIQAHYYKPEQRLIRTEKFSLGIIVTTFKHHQVHHGRNPYCVDKNYGGTLIIWDRIYGK